MIEKETTFIFVNTLHALYYDKMKGNAMNFFSNMVLLWELIEHAIKNKKLEVSRQPKRIGLVKKKDGET